MLIKLNDEQRRSLEQSLEYPWLKGEMPVIEKIIDGKANSVEVVNLIKMAYQVGHLNGMTALIDLHNRFD